MSTTKLRAKLRVWLYMRRLRAYNRMFDKVVGTPYLIEGANSQRLLVSSHFDNQTHFILRGRDG